MLKTKWIFLFFALLYTLGIYWGMPSEFVPEIDSEFPSGPMNFIAHFKDPSYASPYPVFHKLLALPLYAVILAGLKITGGFSSFSSVWPYGFDDPAMAMTLFIMAARLLSLLMGAGTVCIGAAIVSGMVAGSASKYRWMAFAPVLAFGLSGVVAYYSRSSNYDGPQLFWWALSFYFLWTYCRGTPGHGKALLLSALFGGIAAAVKDQIAFFIVGFSLALLFRTGAPKPFRGRVRAWLFYSAAALGAYVCAAVLPQPFHWLAHIRQAFFLTVTSGKFVMFTGDIHGQWALLTESVRCLSHVMSWPGIVVIGMGIAALIVLRQWRILCIVGVPALFSYVFMLARALFVYERWMLNYAFLSSVVVAAAIVSILDRVPRARQGAVGAVIAVLAGIWLAYQTAFSFLPVTFAQVRDAKSRLAAELPGLVDKGDTLSFQGTIFTLPNAQVYRDHPCALPARVYDSIRSTRMGQAIARSDAQRRFVLADHDLFGTERFQRDVDQWSGKDWVDTTGLRRVLEIRNPAWIEDHMKVYSAAHRARTFRVSLRYYFYERAQTPQ